MALKDCTYTVTVDGKTRTFDYDGFRAFLLEPKNLTAVAPAFAGQDVKAARKAGQAERAKQEPTRKEVKSKPNKIPTGEAAEKLILEGMRQVDFAAMNGALVSLTELRDLLTPYFPAKTDFDQAILTLAQQDRFALHRHVHVGRLSPAERDSLVTDGRGNYFIGIALRLD